MTASSDEDVPVTKYIVARKLDAYDLEIAVSALIDEGYMPVGGLCSYVKIYRTGVQGQIFAQAMIYGRQDD